MKLKAFISAWVSPENGEIYISASRYPGQTPSYFDICETPSYFDICEMSFEVPEAAINASEAIKNDTGEIEKKIAKLQKMLEDRRAAK